MAVLLGALLPAPGCHSPEERAERARATAREALERGDRRAALEALEALRATRPDDPDSLLELAALMVLAGEAPQAVWKLEEAVRRFPETDALKLALTRTALLVEDPSLARSVAVEIAPTSEAHPTALVLRAQAELALGHLDEALRLLGEAEERYPDRPEARGVRVATLVGERRYDEARAAIEEARASERLEPEMLRRFELVGARIQALQDDVEGALVSLRRIVERSPDDIAAWHLRVALLHQNGRGAEATELVEAAVEAHPEVVELDPLLAATRGASGDREGAIEALRHWIGRSHAPSAYVQLADFHLRGGEGERARRVVAEAIERHPEEPRLRELHTDVLITLGELDEARAELEAFRRALPGDPRVEFLRARIELAEGDPRGAVDRLERIIPKLDQADTQFWLGRALEEIGDFRGAERRYGLAHRRAPSELAPQLGVIRLADRRGDWGAVAAFAQRLLRSHPDEPAGLAALAQAMVRLERGQEAEAVAKRLVEVAPDEVEGALLLAQAQRARGRLDLALATLREAASRPPGSDALDAEWALTLGLAGDASAGIAHARASLASNPESASLHRTLAALLFQVGNREDGERAAERALALAPDDPTPLRLAAEFLASRGAHEDARRAAERYLRIRTDDAGVYFVLGVAQAGLGDDEAAIASYRKAAALDDGAFAARNNLAELLAKRGDLAGALEAAQQAYAIAGGNPYVIDTLGWLYWRRGLVDRAISLLEEAHRALPAMPDAQYHLALAYRDAGRHDEARRLLESLLDGEEADGFGPRAREALRSLP